MPDDAVIWSESVIETLSRSVAWESDCVSNGVGESDYKIDAWGESDCESACEVKDYEMGSF